MKLVRLEVCRFYTVGGTMLREVSKLGCNLRVKGGMVVSVRLGGGWESSVF